MVKVGTGHKGRVFYSYLLSFLAILLVPVVMSLFVFQRANSVIQADAESANDALLTQTRAYLDMLMDDVLQLNFLVSYNNSLETLLYDRLPLTGEQYYLAWGTAQEFQDYRDSTSAVVDFYVYLPNIDMVVSPDGYFTTWNFHLTRRGGDPEQYDEWLENLRAITRTTFRPDRVAFLPRTDIDVPIDTIEIVSALPASQPTTQPRGYVVLQMRQDLFLKPIEGTTWSDESIFLVYHPDQGLISSSAPRVTSALLDEQGIAPRSSSSAMWCVSTAFLTSLSRGSRTSTTGGTTSSTHCSSRRSFLRTSLRRSNATRTQHSSSRSLRA